MLQAVNVFNLPSIVGLGLKSSWATELYAYSTFNFYVIQVFLMVVSVWVVTVKSKQLALLQANPVRVAFASTSNL